MYIYSLPHIIKRLKQPHLWNPQFLELHIYAVFTIIIIITNHHHYLHLFTPIYTRVTIYHHHYLHHYLHQLSPTIITSYICRLLHQPASLFPSIITNHHHQLHLQVFTPTIITIPKHHQPSSLHQGYLPSFAGYPPVN